MWFTFALLSTFTVNCMMATTILSFHDFKFNPPAHSHQISESGTKVTIRAVPETDWWRIPPPDSVNSITGTFLSTSIDATKDWEAGVWIRGEWGTLFDQGTLMLLTEQGQGNWIKAGVEMENGKEWIGGVVTNPWSDWAIAPAEHSTSTLVEGSYAVYLHMVRKGPWITIYQHFGRHITHERPADEKLSKIREVRAFDVDSAGVANAKAGDKWRIGVMVCGPKNSNGTVAEFENFFFKYL
ncbi:hypothetical protein C8J56DRAFT_911257 [Mycena floridula]|nr:hypothetical protein C8J56DRAFT_911257 [Mycena floridula]